MKLEEVHALHRRGDIVHAEASYRELIEAEPANAGALYGLGMLLHQTGRDQSALKLFEDAIEALPGNVDFRCNYAVLLNMLGRHRDAIETLGPVLKSEVRSATAHDLYGAALEKTQQHRHARDAFRRAIEIDPNCFDALLHLAINLRKDNQTNEAVRLLERAVELRRGDIHALRELTAGVAAQGDAERMLALHMRTIKLPEANSYDYGNLIFSLHYSAKTNPQTLFEATKAWAARNAEPLTKLASPPQRDKDPNRPLRIGYLSSDIREHPVGRLLSPIVAGHDKAQFRSFVYCDNDFSDQLTDHIKSLADEWRSIHRVSDVAAKELIEKDQIDIMVELNGYFGNHRLTLMARRTAPIQICALGYCNTSGLSAIDYRVTDARSDPPGVTDQFHTEKLLRLEDCCWCYEPWDKTPDLRPPPCVTAGYITFGNLNNAIKTSDPTAAAWAEILKRVARSRLLLLTPGGVEDFVAERFAKLGIERDRLVLIRPTHRQIYLDLYNLMDIALDPFPFNGDNTTCDALWMGVPVIALLGNAFWSRRGFSHLAALGLEELVALDTESYINVAARVAGNPKQLIQWRGELRDRLVRSPLGDRKTFIAKLEAAYRAIWQNWCKAG
jgi:protein O-GlcNAc transferase